mmetsp:Transcript_83313/g.156785  ORF Transcript_83313/g.156785 Transcript_83313/m.156785 type:complete len:225 (+) Transcript_83313:662-1336(+)
MGSSTGGHIPIGSALVFAASSSQAIRLRRAVLWGSGFATSNAWTMSSDLIAASSSETSVLQPPSDAADDGCNTLIDELAFNSIRIAWYRSSKRISKPKMWKPLGPAGCKAPCSPWATCSTKAGRNAMSVFSATDCISPHKVSVDGPPSDSMRSNTEDKERLDPESCARAHSKASLCLFTAKFVKCMHELPKFRPRGFSYLVVQKRARPSWNKYAHNGTTLVIMT